MSKVKAMKEKVSKFPKDETIKYYDVEKDISVAKQATSYTPELRYLVKREATFWKKGMKVLQYYNGAQWVDVPKVRTV